ncbi:MAG: class I SAM-dependent methyltransferase [Aeromicrobium sp.]|nr:class I SAM-dependent methyltransferase [Burkholderiales bacterium]
MANEVCPVCENRLHPGYQSWHSLCRHCGYEKSDLQPAINLDVPHKLIDESSRETGLRELRIENFRALLEILKPIKPGGGRLLDVGCAHGWFLDIAKQDFEVLGVEPDKSVFEVTSKRGLPVRFGYFPEALEASEKFDVIVFNDVIEHIQDVENILSECNARLNDNGLLLLNIPNSRGTFYRLSKLFSLLGAHSFFERLWQKSFPSPHLHYFNSLNINQLLERSQFKVERCGYLPSLKFKGLYSRISYTNGDRFIVNSLVYLILTIFLLPIIHVLPKDIVFVIGKKMN